MLNAIGLAAHSFFGA